MSRHNSRLTRLERRAQDQPAQPPQLVEIYGADEAGNTYLMETWNLTGDKCEVITHEQPEKPNSQA